MTSIELQQQNLPFRFFSDKLPSKKIKSQTLGTKPTETIIHKGTDPTTSSVAFSDLSLSEWTITTIKTLNICRPKPVQCHCIPQILDGKDVLAIAPTGSGKTATFALPILQKLSEDPYGVFALVVTPTMELAVQLFQQFKAFGASMNVRCCLVIGGSSMVEQAKKLAQRPHVVVATPGRIRDLMEQDPDIAATFSKTKFLVLDEADRVLDVNFEGELRVVFKCLPKNRQTLLFSATKTNTLALHEISSNSTYFYEEYEGMRTVDTLKQYYIFTPEVLKELYLFHILSNMEDKDIRSAIVFVANCNNCFRLCFLLEELGTKVAALNSGISQRERLSALNRFKSGHVSVLLATDVASRGLDIPSVDLVINYDIPRDTSDYVHRVGRTARAGRGGLSINFNTQYDIDLNHVIEDEIKKKFVKYECNDKEVLKDITKVFKARRVAKMKMIDERYEEKANARKKLRKRRREGVNQIEL